MCAMRCDMQHSGCLSECRGGSGLIGVAVVGTCRSSCNSRHESCVANCSVLDSHLIAERRRQEAAAREREKAEQARLARIEAAQRQQLAATRDRPAPRQPLGASREHSGAVIAVFDVEAAPGEFRPRILEEVTDYLATGAAERLGLRVVPRSAIREQLREEKADSYRPCYDESCQVELGKALAAQKILTTKLLRRGESCIFTVRIFDLKTETTDGAATARADCSDMGLLDAADEVVTKLAAARR